MLALATSRGKAIQSALADAGLAAERVRVDKAVAVKGDGKTKLIATKLTIDVKAALKQPEAKPAAAP